MENTTEAIYRGATPSDCALYSVENEVAPTLERRHLLVFNGASSWMYRLPASGEVIIGRSETADLRIEEGSVSRQHARLAVDSGSVTISDLGSHNGTYVNKVKITGSCLLRPNDVIRIRKATLVFYATTLANPPTANDANGGRTASESNGANGAVADADQDLLPELGRGPQFRPIADELRELEATRIRQALEVTRGNQTRAAALLAMPIRTFFEKVKLYGLRKKRFDH